ncbi:MAG: hypothetical protein K2I80_05995 [Ruminococcus sp.]|nr:hypothetical protein [Ruminococcus sp.]
MKRFISLLTAFLSLACFLSSCGHDEEISATDDVSVFESETESAETVMEEETTEFSETDEMSVFVGKWQGEKFITDGEESDLFLNIPVCEACRIELCADGSVVFYGTAELAEPEIKWNWSRLSSATEIEIFDSENYENRSVLTFDDECLIVCDEYSD